MFAGGRLARGTVLDRGYVVEFLDDEDAKSNFVERYAFDFDGVQVCTVLGIASLCNHSAEANAEIEIDDERGTCRLLALRDIKRGEEIFIDYGAEYWQDLAGT